MSQSFSCSPDAAEQLRAHFADQKSRSFIFECTQYYLPGKPVLALFAALAADASGGRPSHYVVISDRVEEARRLWSGSGESVGDLRRLAGSLSVPLINLSSALSLVPVEVAKPWGREIWYTGIEERGQSLVTDGVHAVPLPWLLALGSTELLDTGSREPCLLKILDPLPEPVYGDLYFELHREKREVYVVTHVSPDAWPEGRGAIRFGFDTAVRRRYASDAAFRTAFREAVGRYEQIRREIDARLDDFRREEGIELNSPVPAATTKRWAARLPATLRREEEAARATMDGFTRLLPLKVGDVVKVPTLTPHALQHGVRTVEFQTPVYERKILSFAQKVLTQSHWDTDEAVALMEVETREPEPLVTVEKASDYLLEQVVCFDDFEVQRLTLEPGCRFAVPHRDTYKVIMTVTGSVACGGCRFGPEQAFLLPRCAGDGAVAALGDKPAVLLIARPLAPD